MQQSQMRARLNRRMKTLFNPDQKRKIPDSCPEFYIEIMERCCTVDRDLRPDFKGIITKRILTNFTYFGRYLKQN